MKQKVTRLVPSYSKPVCLQQRWVIHATSENPFWPSFYYNRSRECLSDCHARAYLNAMRLLDVVDDGGALPLLDGVADGLVNSVTLLAIDCITDLFSLDAIGRPALLLVVDLAFLREVGVEWEGKLKGFSVTWLKVLRKIHLRPLLKVELVPE